VGGREKGREGGREKRGMNKTRSSQTKLQNDTPSLPTSLPPYLQGVGLQVIRRGAKLRTEGGRAQGMLPCHTYPPLPPSLPLSVPSSLPPYLQGVGLQVIRLNAKLRTEGGRAEGMLPGQAPTLVLEVVPGLEGLGRREGGRKGLEKRNGIGREGRKVGREGGREGHTYLGAAQHLVGESDVHLCV